jgi:adenine-specific DNA-methyltransferase
MEVNDVAYPVTEPQALFSRPADLQTRKDLGAVYTPNSLADWVANLIAESLPSAPSTIIDFGCGEGALLSAMHKALPFARLVGIETNNFAISHARKLLPSTARLIEADVLNPTGFPNIDLAKYWCHSIGSAPDAVIMNPPWGAVHSLSKASAKQLGLTLAVGQYDTYDLFCELAIKAIRDGGAFGFILPDSVLLSEHRRLREFLLEKTSLKLIARLGEGLFPSVYCGCVVIVGVVGTPLNNHMTECLRVTKQNRIKPDITFDDHRRLQSHFVKQSRFKKNGECRFDIDVSMSDKTVEKIQKFSNNWTGLLDSRRGAEISKSGKVVFCGNCGFGRPLPKSPNPSCHNCNGSLSNGKLDKIVSQTLPTEGTWAPFIVGEDVKRYAVSSRRWLRTDLSGISYKRRSKTGQPRILIRKTGIGLNAALDATDALTNQVVFEYTLKVGVKLPFSYIHYVLGVLCSRTLFAFHLKRGGELEWRSHPYVTQKSLATLPIPVPQKGTPSWKQAAAIASAVERHLLTGNADLEIEALVAGLFKLERSDMDWVSDVLNGAADLDAMTRLRLEAGMSIEPIRVE